MTVEKMTPKESIVGRKSPDVITFGCRLNIVESAMMKELSSSVGLGDAIIINTCAVTNEAERQARQAIRKAHRQNPNKPIIVTGCAAQIRPKSFASLPGVTQVIGNHEKTLKKTFKTIKDRSCLSEETVGPQITVSDIMSSKETAQHVITSFDGKARAYVEIQNGCNHRCTFCTIPFGRGNNRSAPIAQVVLQIQNLVEQGYNEIVLTGVDITDYGQDLPGCPRLGDLVRRILGNVPELKRLRLSSLDPVEIDETLYGLIAYEKKLLSHFHLSAQAGDTIILKRMKRRHLPENIVNCIERIRQLRPDSTFGGDFIAGFPTESESMFETTYQLIKELRFTYLHVFPYSARPGTPAARMPQVPGVVIKDRAARLRALGSDLKRAYYERCIGKTMRSLIEGSCKARTDTYAVVELDETAVMGKVEDIKIESVDINTGNLRGFVVR